MLLNLTPPPPCPADEVGKANTKSLECVSQNYSPGRLTRGQEAKPHRRG